MPSPRVLDLSPIPRTKETPLEQTLGSFTKRYRENQVEQQDTDALRDIYSQHLKDGKGFDDAIMAIQTRPGISPTTRVNSVKQLMELKEHNVKLQKEAKVEADKAEEKAREKASNKAKVADLEVRRLLKPGTLSAYEDDPKMAEQVSRQPKETKKTQASQPIDADQLRRIQEVERKPEYAKASIPEKKKMFRDNDVSKENTDSIVDAFIQEEKLKPGSKYAEKRESQIADYVDNAIQSRDAAEEMKFTLETAKQAVVGDVQGPGFMALIKDNPYGQLVVGLTPDEASLQASNKKTLEGTKGIFGSKPTEREIFLLLNSMLPAIGKSKEANLASIYFIEKLNDLKIMHGNLVEEISKDGYVPDIQSQVNQRMKPMIEEYKQELQQAVKAVEQTQNNSNKKTIRVKAPDGSSWDMTQEQINAAREKNVIFTPA